MRKVSWITLVLASTFVASALGIMKWQSRSASQPSGQGITNSAATTAIENVSTSQASTTLKTAALQKTVSFLMTIKRSMRDPDSIVWETILANEEASVICVRYKAKNGLGEYARELGIFEHGTVHQSTDSWNDICADQKLNDVIYARHSVG